MSDKNIEKSKKISKRKKRVIYSLAVIFIILITLAGSGYFYINNTLNKVQPVSINTAPENIGIKEETEKNFSEIRNIALLGIDSSDGDVGRSDSIMILTLDGINKKLKLTSIMRDSYVEIDGYGLDKINHAYAFGGPELTLKTLNENFNLNIKEFMSVNFDSLVNIIDEVGGITVNLNEEELPHISGINETGNQVLNGEQALDYSRIRYATGGDYKRTERQRIVVEAVFNKLKSTKVTEFPSLVNELLPFIQTNMSSSDMLKLATDFSFLASSGIEQNRFPTDEQAVGEIINEIYYLTFDREVVKNSVYDYIFKDF